MLSVFCQGSPHRGSAIRTAVLGGFHGEFSQGRATPVDDITFDNLREVLRWISPRMSVEDADHVGTIASMAG
jgi:hypothetical protein